MTKRILITGARAPVALHFARLLSSAGHEVILADSQRFPIARATKHKSTFARLPKPSADFMAYGRAVEHLVKTERIDGILPTCEEIFYLAAWRDQAAPDLPLWARPFSNLAAVHNKFNFAVSTKGHAAKAPETLLLQNKADVQSVCANAKNLVFKPVWSRFGSKVLIQPGREALKDLAPTPEYPWVAQTYLPGEELCCWAWLHKGQAAALSTYRPLYRVGQGAAMAFTKVEEPAIEKFVQDYGTQQNWTGHFSFDFKRSANGKLHVIECNPRATSGAHFFSTQSNIVSALLDGTPAKPDVTAPMTLPIAMVLYGLPQVIRASGWAGLKMWRKDMSSMVDVSAWPGDRSQIPIQLLSFCEIALAALRTGRSLAEATTLGIEWNGEPLNSVGT